VYHSNISPAETITSPAKTTASSAIFNTSTRKGTMKPKHLTHGTRACYQDMDWWQCIMQTYHRIPVRHIYTHSLSEEKLSDKSSEADGAHHYSKTKRQAHCRPYRCNMCRTWKYKRL